MEIIAEKEWFVSFPLNVDLNELIDWSQKIMASRPGSPTTTGEHETGIWWMEETPKVLKDRLLKIVDLNPEWPSSIWEWADGGPLLMHKDGVGRGASLISILKGKFEIFRHDPDTGEISDSYVYGPGQIVALKNGHKTPHSGRCLEGYRLAICTFATNENDPFRDYGKFREKWG